MTSADLLEREVGGGRYYDPATGQFLSVDPLVDINGQPYAYADDNPVNETDPTGLGFWSSLINAGISVWAYLHGLSPHRVPGPSDQEEQPEPPRIVNPNRGSESGPGPGEGAGESPNFWEFWKTPSPDVPWWFEIFDENYFQGIGTPCSPGQPAFYLL